MHHLPLCEVGKKGWFGEEESHKSKRAPLLSRSREMPVSIGEIIILVARWCQKIARLRCRVEVTG